MTGTSTLDPDNFPERPDRSLGKGHGIDALGPSDISDTGSDVVGGPGFAEALDADQTLDFDHGTTSDMEESHAGGTAGPDVGDANFSGDSDMGGTGERGAPGRDDGGQGRAASPTHQGGCRPGLWRTPGRTHCSTTKTHGEGARG